MVDTPQETTRILEDLAYDELLKVVKQLVGGSCPSPLPSVRGEEPYYWVWLAYRQSRSAVFTDRIRRSLVDLLSRPRDICGAYGRCLLSLTKQVPDREIADAIIGLIRDKGINKTSDDFGKPMLLLVLDALAVQGNVLGLDPRWWEQWLGSQDTAIIAANAAIEFGLDPSARFLATFVRNYQDDDYSFLVNLAVARFFDRYGMQGWHALVNNLPFDSSLVKALHEGLRGYGYAVEYRDVRVPWCPSQAIAHELPDIKYAGGYRGWKFAREPQEPGTPSLIGELTGFTRIRTRIAELAYEIPLINTRIAELGYEMALNITSDVMQIKRDITSREEFLDQRESVGFPVETVSR